MIPPVKNKVIDRYGYFFHFKNTDLAHD